MPHCDLAFKCVSRLISSKYHCYMAYGQVAMNLSVIGCVNYLSALIIYTYTGN